MRSLAAFSRRRPGAALLGWLLVTVAVAVLGAGHARLQPASLQVAGTEAARAQALTAGRFDASSTVPVLLTGPSRDVRSQGHRLADRLARVPGVTLASPWNAPTLRAALRPAADKLLLLASVAGSPKTVEDRVTRLSGLVAATTSAPVHAHVTGLPLVSRALADSSRRAVHRADLVAIPALLLVLLLVFRSPVAAAIPVLFGGATVLSATGLVQLLSQRLPVDGLGTALASMMGLALAVDYSLLMVSRFREERRAGHDVAAAADAAVVGTRHTVLTAGASILLAMVLVALLGPGTPVVSAAVGVGAAAVIAVLGAGLAMPAALVLAGHRLAPAVAAAAPAAGPPPPGVWERVGRVAMARPVRTVAAGCLALALVAVPALSLRTAGPDAGQLPASSAARADLNAVNAAVGPGWGASFELVAVARKGTMTTPARLRALTALQRELSADPQVRAVLGPGTIAARAERLRRDGRRLLRQQKALAGAIPAQTAKLTRLRGSVGRLRGGVGGLSGAFTQADTAARQLGSGSSALAGGVARLRGGLAGAADGARRLTGRLRTAAAGTTALTAGAAQAQDGSAQLADAIHRIGGGFALASPAVRVLADRIGTRRDDIARVAADARTQNQTALAQLADAQRALMGVRPGLASVRTAQAISAAKGTIAASQVATSLDTVAADLNAQIASTSRLADSLAKISVHPLAAKARTLTAGLATLKANLEQLSGSVSTLTGSTDAVQGALAKLDGGTATLGAGVHRLAAGVAGVTDSVAASRRRSDTLVRGLNGAQGELAGLSPGQRGATRAGTDGTSPSVIDSGYFVLAALDGRGGGTGLNVDRGGQAARVLIVPRIAPSDPRAPALYRRLTAAAQRFGRATGTDTAVGGSSALLLDYERQAHTRFPLIVLVLALATTLLLAVLLRSLLVPVIGVALTLLTVGATIGLMGTFFAGSLDATTVIAVFAVMFALSIDYQVFIVGRIREEFDRGADAQAAVMAGLRSTAHVVTGAAVSMLAVFMAFATTDVPSIRQFGVGLAIAVALDATVVRLVVLPAALKLAGRRAWGPAVSPPRSGAPARTARARSVPPDARAVVAPR